MAIPLKCVVVLLRMSPEGNTTLSNQSLQWVSSMPQVLWKNPAANITFSVITLETVGIISAEIYVIMAIPLKCVAVIFRMSPEGNTILSNQSLQPVSSMPKVLWINPAANT